MRLTKFGHACVRISYDGHDVVIDPGVLTDPAAVDGADAVLITHEHLDHWTADNLRATEAPIWTIAAVAAAIHDAAPELDERVTVVAPGSALDVVGVPVTVVGEKHAVIHPELPHFDNSGYLLTLGNQTVFHPGDSLTHPGQDVDVLLLPVSAPWMRVSEAIDYARDVGAPRNVAIHDLVYSDFGLSVVDGHFGRFLAPQQQEYVRLAAGADL